jgi:hypothetical protein
MTISWITPPGSLGILTERVIVDIPLQATSSAGEITYTLISGSLPRGLRLSNGSIKGSPTEVRKFTESRFVVRASNGQDLEDRTFKLSVDGSDIPQWITAEGFLNVGPAQAFFVLDNARVDFQLEVDDRDIVAGDNINFYLLPNGGDLPPGLSITREGRITGFTDPVFAVDYAANDLGSYDNGSYDTSPLDIIRNNSNGYDTFFYDNVNFDYSEESRVPRKLSRIYTFAVAATDGVNVVTRIFKIYVVTEEFLRSDNNIVQVDTNLFTADVSAFRVPLWITESNLGRYRANNYLTVFLDVYDPPELSGTILYFLQPLNKGTYRIKENGRTTLGAYEISGRVPLFPYNLRDEWSKDTTYIAGDAAIYIDDIDSTVRFQTWVCIRENRGVTPAEGNFWTKQQVFTSNRTFRFSDGNLWETVIVESASTLPDGMALDQTTGEIAGVVPYQRRITKSFKFSILAVNFPESLATRTYNLRGSWNISTQYLINDAVFYGDDNVIYIANRANSSVNPTDQSIWEQANSSSEKTFTIDIIGEIESGISWLSDSALGTIKPNQRSLIEVRAENLLYRGTISYQIESGELPPGLNFLSNGLIEGKVKQFGDSQGPGLTRFYEKDSSSTDSTGSFDFSINFDGGDTSFDKIFKFVIKARDSLNFAEAQKEFQIRVISDNTKTFSNLYLTCLQSKEKRLSWFNFITDVNIFQPSDIFRYGDSEFGIQTDIKILLFAGIESVEAVKYVQAMSRNHYRKRLFFGDLKTATAKDPVTQENIYEVVYVEIIDDLETKGKSISPVIQLPDYIESKVLVSYDAIKIDSDIPLVSDSDHQRIFPNSIKNMRNRIRDIGDRDREFLPLWMRSIQDLAAFETGYSKAHVLCYAKPGKSLEIISRIRASKFDFKNIDFEIDRYLIDSIDKTIENKYLAFPQTGEKLP